MTRNNKSVEFTQQISELIAANQLLKNEIKERLRIEAEMQTTIDRFQNLADNAPALIAVVNARTLLYEFVNAPIAATLALPREEIIGLHIRVLIGEENFQFAQKYIADVRPGKTVSYENTFTSAYDKPWMHVNYSPVFNANSQVVSFIVLSWNITNQKLADEKIKSLLAEKEIILKEMEKLVITDPLTRAYNRRYFCEVGAREMTRSRRTGNPLSIYYVRPRPF